jgi:hypothetical protein
VPQTSAEWCFEKQMCEMAALRSGERLYRKLRATFVEPNSWIGDEGFGRDGLHLIRNGARQLGDFYSRVCGIDGESQEVINDYTRRGASSVRSYQKDPERRLIKKTLRWVWKR